MFRHDGVPLKRLPTSVRYVRLPNKVVCRRPTRSKRPCQRCAPRCARRSWAELARQPTAPPSASSPSPLRAVGPARARAPRGRTRRAGRPWRSRAARDPRPPRTPPRTPRVPAAPPCARASMGLPVRGWAMRYGARAVLARRPDGTSQTPAFEASSRHSRAHSVHAPPDHWRTGHGRLFPCPAVIAPRMALRVVVLIAASPVLPARGGRCCSARSCLLLPSRNVVPRWRPGGRRAQFRVANMMSRGQSREVELGPF